jgi:DNA-binding transcriptional MerR regulator
MAALRPVDLARLAGISTQQVRNYADAGILPPAGRSAAGYRRFSDQHRRAMLTYRALGRGYGWDTARDVMHAVHSGDVPRALALIDAGHAALHDERRSLRTVAEALAATASGEQPAPQDGLRIGEVAARLGVRTSALRVWESAGLLQPGRERGTGYRIYDRIALRDARMILMLRQGRYPLSQVKPILDGLRRAGSTDALRTATAERQAALTIRATAMLAAASHLHDYLSEAPPAR